MLSLQDYQCILALDRIRHFGRAAEALGITQPSLTARLRRIEQVLEVRLFERGRAGVTPTEAGVAFLDGAKRVLAAADDTAQAAKRAQAGFGPHLRVGMTQYAAHMVVPACLGAYRDRRSLARISVHEAPTAALEQLLETRGLDIAFVHPPLHASEVSDRLLHEAQGAAYNLAEPAGPAAAPTIRYPRAEASLFMGRPAKPERDPADEGETLAEANSILGAIVLSQAGYGTVYAPSDYPHPVLAAAETAGPPDEGLVLQTSVAWRTLDRRDVVRAFVDCCLETLGRPSRGS